MWDFIDCRKEENVSIECAEGLYQYNPDSKTESIFGNIKEFFKNNIFGISNNVENCQINRGISILCSEGRYEYLGDKHFINVDQSSIRTKKPKMDKMIQAEQGNQNISK